MERCVNAGLSNEGPHSASVQGKGRRKSLSSGRVIAVEQTRVKPTYHLFSEADVIFKVIQEDVIINSVKSSMKIKQN